MTGKEDKAALLALLLVLLGIVLLTTDWWRAGLVALLLGLVLPGLGGWRDALGDGFFEILGWTDEES